MTVEAATLPQQLNVTLPADTDPLAEGKNHLRLLKTVLTTTFANLANPITASDADLNSTTGLAAKVTALQTSTVQTASSTPQAVTGGLSVSGGLNGDIISQGGNPLIPRGVTVFWQGLATNVPAGWNLCDGTNGTVDLRGMFIVGAGNTGAAYLPGQTGGTATQTITTASAGAHNHTGNTNSGGGVTPMGVMDQQGSHNHTGSTAGYALQVGDLAPHAHQYEWIGASQSSGATFAGSGSGYPQALGTTQSTGSGNPHVHGISSDGTHAHNITMSPLPSHVHGIGTDGAHTHTATFDQRPPYYALCMIMKL